MRRSRTNTSQQAFDALTVSAELVILGGSTRQMYYTAEASYEEDRKWVPCILHGNVYVIDPTGVMGGKTALSGIEWYTQMPVDGDYSTGRIVNPSQSVLNDTDTYDPVTGELTHEAAWRSVDYLISDGSDREWCNGVPKDGLIIHKNVTQLTAMPIYGVLKFVDTRKGITMRINKNINFTTEVVNNEGLTMKGNCGSEIILDPLSFPDTIPAGQSIVDIPWMCTVSAQLYGSEAIVSDNKACYLWVREDSTAATGWREFTDDEKGMMRITTDKAKDITLDARMISGYLRLRCYACRRKRDAAWSSPLSVENSPFYETQLTINLNDTLHFDPTQLTGAFQGPNMNNVCRYEMQFRYNGVDVPEEKRSLFLVLWWAQDLKTGAKHQIGCGPKLIFKPSEYGFSYPDGFNVWGDVYSYKNFAIVTQDGKTVVQDGKIVISPQYE